MIRSLSCLTLSAALIALRTSAADARDWMYLPSTYSHDWQSGQRVTQFAPVPPVIVYQRPDYLKSGFRHQRSTINAGGSQDNYITVDQYGGEVRPYGEWLFPYRPYSVPYDAWGPPFGGVNGEYFGDEFRRGFPAVRGGRGGFNDFGAAAMGGAQYGIDAYGGAGGRRNDGRFESQRQMGGRYNGLFDGRGIPGDDEHYLNQPRRLEQMNDREFFSRPGSRRP
jgi:hypothetical protein